MSIHWEERKDERKSKITNTGRASTINIHHIYYGRIQKDATLVSDNMYSYVRFTNANGIELVQLKTGKAKNSRR
jgi:ribonucleotide monophosphatase NagD (HAD superfamily)